MWRNAAIPITQFIKSHKRSCNNWAGLVGSSHHQAVAKSEPLNEIANLCTVLSKFVCSCLLPPLMVDIHRQVLHTFCPHAFMSR